MRPIFSVLLLVGILFSSSGQFSKELFHDGYLVSADGDTVRGLVKYDMETNIVQVIHNNVVKTFSSHKIFYFEIYDKLVDNYRQFYSIPYNVNYNYKIPIIFEVLYEGPLSLLSREAIVSETVSNNAAYWGAVMRDKVDYSFYFLDKQGNIQYYSGKKNDLLRIMARKSSQVKSFVKKNKLKYDEIRDLIRITAFYNSL